MEFEVGQTWVEKTPTSTHCYRVVRVDDKEQRLRLEYWPDHYPEPHYVEASMELLARVAELWTADMWEDSTS